MPSSAAVEARELTKVFDADRQRPVRALDGVSLVVRQGEFFTLLGPSGCGKTTLLRLIAGFEEPTAGRILLDGQPIEGLPPYRRPVNTVFQSYALFPHMTVAGNVAFGLEMQGVRRREAARRVGEALELVQLGGMQDRRPAQLSGGQQQRVALARALVNRPKVLLLDEPLSALDLKLRKEMQLELKKLQRETGVTFVFVTHDQGEALTMSDRVAVMRDGHVLQVGSPREIYEHPRSRFVADFIGETNFLEARVVAVGDGVARCRLASGAEIAASPRPGCAAGEAVTLAVRPERLALTAPGNGAALRGRVAEAFYVGTDTTYHVTLADGAGAVMVRKQNRRAGLSGPRPGDAIGVAVPPDAAQMLVD